MFGWGIYLGCLLLSPPPFGGFEYDESVVVRILTRFVRRGTPRVRKLVVQWGDHGLQAAPFGMQGRHGAMHDKRWPPPCRQHDA